MKIGIDMHQKKIFSELTWLCKAAVSDQRNDKIFKTVFSQNGWLYATDAHRVHMIEQDTDFIPEGRYRITTITKNRIELTLREDDCEYPDIDVHLNYRPVNDIKPFKRRGASQSAVSMFLFHVYRNIGLFNETFLREAFTDADTISFERTNPNNRCAPLVMSDGTRLAMIMPILAD